MQNKTYSFSYIIPYLLLEGFTEEETFYCLNSSYSRRSITRRNEQYLSDNRIDKLFIRDFFHIELGSTGRLQYFGTSDLESSRGFRDIFVKLLLRRSNFGLLSVSSFFTAYSFYLLNYLKEEFYVTIEGSDYIYYFSFNSSITSEELPSKPIGRFTLELTNKEEIKQKYINKDPFHVLKEVLS